MTKPKFFSGEFVRSKIDPMKVGIIAGYIWYCDTRFPTVVYLVRWGNTEEIVNLFESDLIREPIIDMAYA